MALTESIGRRMMPSHPDWPKINELNQMLFIATNPQVFFNGYTRIEGHCEGDNFVKFDEPQVFKALPDAERLAIIDTVKNKLGSKLRMGRFADFINSAEFPLAPEEK